MDNCKNDWISKKFAKNCTPELGYESVETTKQPTFFWKKNPDLDRSLTFQDDPFSQYQPEIHESCYELVWYIDPRFNPLKDKVWAVSCKPVNGLCKGTKDMGYLIPDIVVKINDKIPEFNLNIDKLCPPYWDIVYECVYFLDKRFTQDQDIWVLKFKPSKGKSKGLRHCGIISPKLKVVYNPILPKMNYDIDYIISWYDMKYEHIWMLDRKHLKNNEDDIWAFKITATDCAEGSKIVGYISPNLQIDKNPSLPDINFNIDYVIPWHDMKYEHVWILDKKYNSNQKDVWALTAKYCLSSKKTKNMGKLILDIFDKLDVVFISYKEPNAEENWRRVLEKAPWAKRVNGVTGIFEAHRTAAKMAKTDMFYVVDGDAWLVDDWNFDYQPSIFDRDCAYVWLSKNSVNDLVYEHGGVKLFSKNILIKKKKWNTLDMTLGVMPKIKFMDKISNLNCFNVDKFSTWRTAFRECVKLSKSNQITKLNAWSSLGKDRPFGKYAIEGARAAIEFFEKNKKKPSNLQKINDYKWLQNYYIQTLKKSIKSNK